MVYTQFRTHTLTLSRRQVEGIGLSEVLTAPASPWQNVYAERVIGTIRRDCLDHTIILGEQHLRPTTKRYIANTTQFARTFHLTRMHRESGQLSLHAAAQ
jgi:hypothetical protein